MICAVVGCMMASRPTQGFTVLRAARNKGIRSKECLVVSQSQESGHRGFVCLWGNFAPSFHENLLSDVGSSDVSIYLCRVVQTKTKEIHLQTHCMCQNTHFGGNVLLRLVKCRADEITEGRDHCIKALSKRSILGNEGESCNEEIGAHRTVECNQVESMSSFST